MKSHLFIDYLCFSLQVIAETVDVIVNVGAINYTYSGYEYDAALTPGVSSIVPSTIGVGGENKIKTLKMFLLLIIFLLCLQYW